MINQIKKKPISKLTLADCYLLANNGYEITKSNNIILVTRKGK